MTSPFARGLGRNQINAPHALVRGTRRLHTEVLNAMLTAPVAHATPRSTLAPRCDERVDVSVKKCTLAFAIVVPLQQPDQLRAHIVLIAFSIVPCFPGP